MLRTKSRDPSWTGHSKYLLQKECWLGSNKPASEGHQVTRESQPSVSHPEHRVISSRREHSLIPKVSTSGCLGGYSSEV